VGLVAVTRWQWLDPGVAMLVAGNIVWTGVRIVRRSVLGLMDTAMADDELAALRSAMDPYLGEGVQYHALRTRQAAARRFVSLHILVPGAWTVQQGHHLLERLEADIRTAVPNVSVLTHLESLDDPASWEDEPLDRTPPGQAPPVPSST
jgi:divalent metal cation (Fe/Co/Zn/Cd) transporter